MDGNAALNRLLEGNKRFMTGKLAAKDVKTPREATKAGQKPFASILTCSDSRVVPEFIFDTTIGEIFVVRNAGNCVDTVSLGSLEYGAEHLRTPLLVVLGHEKCGAVTAACSGGVCPPNIQAIMDRIKPAVDKGSRGDVERTVICNVELTADEIRKRSDVISHLESGGHLKIVEMKYFFEDGRVHIIR
ncbi:carbonic anhydrase [Candidatus Micrarchaeota archaeon]|nr:carbonic anhydrase [Candidatus Micrarchaeota archaeon]